MRHCSSSSGSQITGYLRQNHFPQLNGWPARNLLHCGRKSNCGEREALSDWSTFDGGVD